MKNVVGHHTGLTGVLLGLVTWLTTPRGPNTGDRGRVKGEAEGMRERKAEGGECRRRSTCCSTSSIHR